ncbi:hypothetical protein EVG20_g11111, partial [Dentipellis fragilis]
AARTLSTWAAASLHVSPKPPWAALRSVSEQHLRTPWPRGLGLAPRYSQPREWAPLEELETGEVHSRRPSARQREPRHSQSMHWADSRNRPNPQYTIHRHTRPSIPYSRQTTNDGRQTKHAKPRRAAVPHAQCETQRPFAPRVYVFSLYWTTHRPHDPWPRPLPSNFSKTPAQTCSVELANCELCKVVAVHAVRCAAAAAAMIRAEDLVAARRPGCSDWLGHVPAASPPIYTIKPIDENQLERPEDFSLIRGCASAPSWCRFWHTYDTNVAHVCDMGKIFMRFIRSGGLSARTVTPRGIQPSRILLMAMSPTAIEVPVQIPRTRHPVNMPTEARSIISRHTAADSDVSPAHRTGSLRLAYAFRIPCCVRLTRPCICTTCCAGPDADTPAAFAYEGTAFASLNAAASSAVSTWQLLQGLGITIHAYADWPWLQIVSIDREVRRCAGWGRLEVDQAGQDIESHCVLPSRVDTRYLYFCFLPFRNAAFGSSHKHELRTSASTVTSHTRRGRHCDATATGCHAVSVAKDPIELWSQGRRVRITTWPRTEASLKHLVIMRAASRVPKVPPPPKQGQLHTAHEAHYLQPAKGGPQEDSALVLAPARASAVGRSRPSEARHTHPLYSQRQAMDAGDYIPPESPRWAPAALTTSSRRPRHRPHPSFSEPAINSPENMNEAAAMTQNPYQIDEEDPLQVICEYFHVATPAPLRTANLRKTHDLSCTTDTNPPTHLLAVFDLPFNAPDTPVTLIPVHIDTLTSHLSADIPLLPRVPTGTHPPHTPASAHSPAHAPPPRHPH